MANKLLTETLSEPLNGATTAKIDIGTDMGNLTVDRLSGGEPVLASGALEYFEKQGQPTRILDASQGQAALTLRGGGKGRPGFHFPWAACAGGAYSWQIHLNPTVAADITAHSGGGNVNLDLAGMAVTHLMADSGGGNMDVVLPEHAANLNVTVRTGGGNVTVQMGSGSTGSSAVTATSGAGTVQVRVPSGLAVRVHATSGLGKVVVDPGLRKLDSQTYQSPEYEDAANRVEITAKSGAGNVIVSTK